MHEIVVHAIFFLFISFNNYNYDCHMKFIVYAHLFDAPDLNFQYIINEHVTNVKIILLLCYLKVIKYIVLFIQMKLIINVLGINLKLVYCSTT